MGFLPQAQSECLGTILGSIKEGKSGGFCRLSPTESLKFA